MTTIPRDSRNRAEDATHDPTSGVVTYQEEVVRSSVARKLLAALRLVLGFTFMWAFIDKLFGLGYATPAAKAWISGGSEHPHYTRQPFFS